MKAISSRYVIAAWGATGRLEATAGSDVDLICWTPEIVTVDRDELECEISNSYSDVGTYLDLLLFDGSRSLDAWARATGTDLQAVLFASDVNGPVELVAEFERHRRGLWSDNTLRAREVWMLVSATMLQPRLMAMTPSFFRPEKYMVGATRSFVTIAETYAMIHGWKDRLTTIAGLKATESELGFQAGELTLGYERSLTLRLEIERGRDPETAVSTYKVLGELVKSALAALIEHNLDWLQRHAGVRQSLVDKHFRLLFERSPSCVPFPGEEHWLTDAMLVAFSGTDREVADVVHQLHADWFIRYAATGNLNVREETLHYTAFPPYELDQWTNRNIWLWVMRHPNVGCHTIELFLNREGLRPMDFAAANVALAFKESDVAL